MEKKRLHLVDEYRGFWIINMIIYHGIWDLVYIFNCNWKWFRSDIAFIWQQAICWSFIFISGFCWQMSKHNLKRGLQVFAGGMLVTIMTLIFMPNSRVVFGVLTLLGSAMILMVPCHKLFCKINPWIGAFVSFLLFLIVYPVNDGYLGLGEIELLVLPRELYSGWIGSFLGFTAPGFWSTDYFSILPWFLLYIVGYFAYGILFRGEEGMKKQGIKKLMEKSYCPSLGWVGRNALIIYLLHQPVVYGILFLWNELRT